MSNISKPHAPQKACSICGVRYSFAEFTYGGRDNRSYCKSCDKLDQGAYAKGGVDAARKFRAEMRSKWHK